MRHLTSPDSPHMPDVFGEMLSYTDGETLPEREYQAACMRIIVADSQPRTRTGLRRLLEREPGLAVVGEAGDAPELLALLQAGCPDLILLGWDLPGQAPRDLVSTARVTCFGLRIVVLGAQPGDRQAAVGAGADAFIDKDGPLDSLLAAVLDLDG